MVWLLRLLIVAALNQIRKWCVVLVHAQLPHGTLVNGLLVLLPVVVVTAPAQ